jgi:hypothetical protein
VKDHGGSTNILYPSVKCGPVLLHCVAEDKICSTHAELFFDLQHIAH